jgi:hypothetical protein
MTLIAEDSPEYLFDVKGVTVPKQPIDYSALGNDGSFEEICLLKAARERGFVTWMPIGHSQKADAIIWMPPHKPLTVQVKRGQWKNNAWCAVVGAARGGKERRKAADDGRVFDKYRLYEAGDFDVLALYVPPADAFRFWLLNDIAGRHQVSVSDLSTLNNWHVIEDALKA